MNPSLPPVPDLPPIPEYEFEEKTTIAMLRDLCERQRATIQMLQTDLDEAILAGCTIEEQRVRESRERGAELLRINSAIEKMKAATHSVITQRDTVEAALRALYQIATVINPDTIPDRFRHGWERRVREARELISVIDQLKAAQAAADARG
jgi:hypothetical protein